LETTPAAVRQALPPDAPSLTALMGSALTPVEWVKVMEQLGPADLAALDVHLDAWLRADAALLTVAHELAPQWLARASPREWRKAAGLSRETYALLTSAPAPPTDASDAAAAPRRKGASGRTVPDDKPPPLWI
jgi:hypothetical protein